MADWEALSEPTLSDAFDGLRVVADLLAEDVGDDPQRLRDIVDVVMRVPSQSRATLLGAIRSGLASAGDDLRQEIARLLADQVTRHRKFADADWSVPEEELAAVEALALELDPAAMAAPDIDWFAYWPRRAMDDDSLTPQEAQDIVERERKATIERLLETGGLDAVTRLAGESQATYVIGSHLAAFDLGVNEPTLLALITGADPVAQMVRGYVAQKFRTGQLAWLERALAAAPSEDVAAEILRSCPPSPDLLALVDGSSPDVQARYWEHPPFLGVPDDYLLAYVERLLAQDRPWTALATITLHRHTETLTPALIDVALRVLEGLRSTGEDGSKIAPELHYPSALTPLPPGTTRRMTGPPGRRQLSTTRRSPPSPTGCSGRGTCCPRRARGHPGRQHAGGVGRPRRSTAHGSGQGQDRSPLHRPGARRQDHR